MNANDIVTKKLVKRAAKYNIAVTILGGDILLRMLDDPDRGCVAFEKVTNGKNFNILRFKRTSNSLNINEEWLPYMLTESASLNSCLQYVAPAFNFRG